MMIEEILFRELISESELNKLNVPLYAYPKPISQIPQFGFSELIRSYIDNTLLSLYRDVKLPKNVRVMLLTFVIGGYGDYYAQLEVAKILKKAFPQIELDCILLLHKDRKINHPHTCHLIPYIGKTSNQVIYEYPSNQVRGLLDTADLIFQVPTYFPHIAELSSHVESLGECGMIETRDFEPRTGNRCMGFHFLEKGVLIKEVPETSSLDSIVTQEITDWMQEGASFNMSYTSSKKGNQEFLIKLLELLEDDKRDVDLLMLSFPEFDPKTLNLEKIVIYHKGYQSKIKINKRGKILRVYVADHIPHCDFVKFMSLTDTLIGCTGDGSLFEAISTGKPFFYDALEHKRSALRYLCFLAKGSAKAFLEGMSYNREALKQDFLALSFLIKERYSINELIPLIVKRAIIHQRYPSLRAIEKEKMNRFADGTLSCYKTLLDIHQCLSKI